MSNAQPFIIGFSGRKGAGKNTCAKILTEHLSRKLSPDDWWSRTHCIETYAFADPMKRLCQQFFALTPEQCYGTDEQKNTSTIIHWDNFPAKQYVDKHTGLMTAREVLQFFGTECIRRMDHNAHIRALMGDIDRENPVFALISDCRFSNEVEAIQNRGGKVIRLTRSLDSNDAHKSETSLNRENYNWENFDAVIDNHTMTLDEQAASLYKLMDQWRIIRP